MASHHPPRLPLVSAKVTGATSARMGSRTFLQPSSSFSWLQGKQNNITVLPQAQLLPRPHLHPLQPSVWRDLAPPVCSTSHRPHLPQPHSGMASSPSPGKQLSILLKLGGGGTGPLLWTYFLLTPDTPLSLGFSDPTSLAFLVTPRSSLLTHVSPLHL